MIQVLTKITKKCQNEAWSEDEAEIPAGVTDTMFTATDFLEDHKRETIHNVAPGEGKRHLVYLEINILKN